MVLRNFEENYESWPQVRYGRTWVPRPATSGIKSKTSILAE